MKKLVLLNLLAICFLLYSCEEESTTLVSNQLNFLLGDKDGFGIGLQEGEAWIPGPPGTRLPVDNRKQ